MNAKNKLHSFSGFIKIQALGLETLDRMQY